MPAVRRAKVELRGFNSAAQSRQREAVRLTPCRKAQRAELGGKVSINTSSRVRADSFARARSNGAKAGRAHDPQTRAKRTNIFPVEPRSGEFHAGTRAPETVERPGRVSWNEVIRT